ncbi:MAG: PAS domain S-box protein [Anaerolineales bacterium]|nr:PAS domain S-box protein [Anaerolineales bacterium]
MKTRKPSPRNRLPSPRKKKPPSAPRRRSSRGVLPRDLSAYFNAPLDLLCILDPDGYILKTNPELEALIGRSPVEMAGKYFLDFFHPDDRAHTLASYREAVAEREVPAVVNRILLRDGSCRWLEWKAYRAGKFVFASARDMTDRKQAEDALRESRQMLATILDAIPVRVFWKDAKLTYCGCNRAFVQTTGCSSAAEIVGCDDYCFLPKSQADLVRADDREVLKSGNAKLLYEEPVVQSDGRTRWLRTSKIPLPSPAGGSRGILGTFEDITEHKLADQALEESEARYRRLIRTITDYIYHVRIDGGKAVETFHGRRCSAVTGYAPEELNHDPGLWIRMIDPQDRPLVEDQVRRILSGREAPVIEHRIRRKDGIRRWVRNTPVLHRDAEGRLLSYDGLVQDITERKEAELQIRAQHDLAVALNATIDMEQGLRLCLETAMRVTGIEAGGIYVVDPRSGAMDLAVHRGIPPEMLAVVRRLEPDRPEARWMMEGQPIYADGQTLKARMPTAPDIYKNFRIMIGIPIRHETRVIGCLNLVSASMAEITPSLREILETTVAQIGNAVGRLRSESALRESEDRYRHLFEAESDAIILVENKSGRILEANNACSALYGYSREELRTMKNTDLSAEPEKTRKLTQTTPLSPESVITVPIRLHRRKDSSVFPVEITSRYFSWHGEPVHLSAIRDISLRRRTEEALRESRRMLEMILDTIPVRVFWKDKDSRYLGCNKPFARDAGFASPSELLGRDDFQMGWVEQADRYRADDRTVIETGREKLGYEEQQTQADGRRIWLRTSKVPLHNLDGSIVGVLGTYEDITDRKQAEEEIRSLNAELEQRVLQRTAQLEAANKELEAFSFSVSHDLRAPLRAIDGFTRALAEDYGKTLNEDARRLCSVIRRNTRHMHELIDDLLALSRLNQTEMRRIPTDLSSMVQSVFQELTTPESRARIDFRLGPLPKASADPTLLRQVWVNLISNAVKFSARREQARIEVECRSTPEEDVFSVRDNGAGFDMHYADRLFGVFQRLHNSAEFEGTGVGLAIVQRIVHRHGGRVWAEGEEDKGAAFSFTLPKDRAIADKPPPDGNSPES